MRPEQLHFPRIRNAAAATVRREHPGEFVRGLLTCPIALPFAYHRHPGDRHCTGRDHATHGHVMSFSGYAAGGIGHDEHVKAFAERLDRRHGEADLSPECGEYELLAAGLLHGIDNTLVFPRVDERAIDRLLVRKYVLQPLDQIPPTLFDDRGENRRDVED